MVEKQPAERRTLLSEEQFIVPSLKSHKSPCNDDESVEFYHVFFKYYKKPLLIAIKSIINRLINFLSTTSRNTDKDKDK